MKTILNVLVLLSVLGLSVAATLESIGFNLAGSVAYALPFGTFIGALLLSTFTHDYDAPARTYEPRARRRPILLPAAEAFAGRTNASSPRPRVLRWNAPRQTRRISAIVSR